MLLVLVIWGVLLSAQGVHLAPLDELTSEFMCIGQACYSISWTSRRYAKARSACTEASGQLMTVKHSVQADVITIFMEKVQKDNVRVWIGLEQPYKDRCTDLLQPLRGFTWVTGDSYTDLMNWKNDTQKCGALCVTVHKDGTWEETDCDSKADGYLCEVSYTASCDPLELPSSYNVTYYHQFLGVGREGGTVYPPGTHALSLFCEDKGDGTGLWSSETPGAWICQLGNGGCEHICDETSGSPQCKCPADSQLKSDGRTCSTPCDPSPCSQHCDTIPDPPGFTCMCSEGYDLAEDGMTCIDIDDCATNPNICEHHCTNTIGSFVCSCKPGFEKVDGICENPDGCDSECQDIDECNNPATLCEHSCENYPGGYICVCDEGFIIDEKNPNKCKRFCNTSFCKAECDVNSKDRCECPDGYILDSDDSDDPICTDVDECEANPCDWICINMFGSYQCTCPEGYTALNNSCIPDGTSGTTTLTELPLPPSKSTPPDIHSHQPAMLLGICIGIISMLAVLIAILCHMLRKHYMEQHAMDYKYKNSEKGVALKQVKTDVQGKC